MSDEIQGFLRYGGQSPPSVEMTFSEEGHRRLEFAIGGRDEL